MSKKTRQKEAPIPFDEALKRVWASPPQHKKGQRRATKKRAR